MLNCLSPFIFAIIRNVWSGFPCWSLPLTISFCSVSQHGIKLLFACLGVCLPLGGCLTSRRECTLEYTPDSFLRYFPQGSHHDTSWFAGSSWVRPASKSRCRRPLLCPRESTVSLEDGSFQGPAFVRGSPLRRGPVGGGGPGPPEAALSAWSVLTWS